MDKRILIITRNFPPILGGMERLLWNVFKQLESDYICDVVAQYRAVVSGGYLA